MTDASENATGTAAPGMIDQGGHPIKSPQETRRAFFRVFPAIMLSMFMAGLDTTIVAAALPAIAGDLGELERISWVVVSYLVAATVSAPVYGRLGDVFGQRRMLFIGQAMFVTGAICCVFSTSMTMLTIARVVQGLGAGGLLTLWQSLVAEAIGPRERPRYQGYLAAVFVISSSSGPVVGGALTALFGWQAIFMVFIPLTVLAAVLALRLEAKPGRAGKFRFDLLGAILLTVFVVALVLALEQAQRFTAQGAWRAAMIGAVSLAALATLLWHELRIEQPLVPIKAFRNPSIWRANLFGALTNGCLVAVVTFMPIYLQAVRGVGPGELGLMLLPMTGFVPVGATLAGRIVTRSGHLTAAPAVGAGVLAVVLALFAFFGGQVSTTTLAFLFPIYALALGACFPSIPALVQHVAGPKLLGAAAASIQVSRSLGSALLTAMVGAALFATTAAADPQLAALFTRLIQHDSTALAGLDPAHIAEVRAGLGDAFRTAFLVVSGFMVVAMGVCLTIPQKRF